MYDVVIKLANASSSLSFEKLVREDGDKAKADIRRLLSCGARVRRSTAAAVATPKTSFRQLRAARIKIHGYETRALSDSGPVPILIS